MSLMMRGAAVVLIATIGVARAAGPQQCKPVLAVNDVRFSQMQPPTLKRTWSASVSVDASACQANSSGSFDIVFTRTSELGPDLEFTERFPWRVPAVEVTVDFWAYEAVQQFRVENITSCVCLN